MTTETWLMRAARRLRDAAPLRRGADRGVAHLVGLKQLRGRLAPTAAAFAVLAAAAGAAFHDRPTVVGGAVVLAAVALVALSFRRFANRAVESLEHANAGRERLEVELALEQEAKEEFRSLAYHDGLTGLPNRSLFYDRLAVAIAHSARCGERLALLYLDLDDFKQVNDSFGHAVGDRVLVELGGRIQAAVRAEDTVARLGGDEFIVLLAEVRGAGDARRVAAKVLAATRPPFGIDGYQVSILASAGLSVYPEDGASPEELVRHADRAMYHDKRQQATPDPGTAAEGAGDEETKGPAGE